MITTLQKLTKNVMATTKTIYNETKEVSPYIAVMVIPLFMAFGAVVERNYLLEEEEIRKCDDHLKDDDVGDISEYLEEQEDYETIQNRSLENYTADIRNALYAQAKCKYNKQAGGKTPRYVLSDDEGNDDNVKPDINTEDIEKQVKKLRDAEIDRRAANRINMFGQVKSNRKAHASQLRYHLYMLMKSKFGEMAESKVNRMILNDFVFQWYEQRKERYKDLREIDLIRNLPYAIELMFIPNEYEINASYMRVSPLAINKYYQRSTPSPLSALVYSIDPRLWMNWFHRPQGDGRQ